MNAETLQQYMTEQAKVLAGDSTLYHSLTVAAQIAGKAHSKFEVIAYCEATGHQYGKTVAEAIGKVHEKRDGRSDIQLKREFAARLLREAEVMENAEAMKNQPSFPL